MCRVRPLEVDLVAGVAEARSGHPAQRVPGPGDERRHEFGDEDRLTPVAVLSTRPAEIGDRYRDRVLLTEERGELGHRAGADEGGVLGAGALEEVERRPQGADTQDVAHLVR